MKSTDHAMRNDPERQNDPELSALLQSWHVEPRHDPALAARVRQQIEDAPTYDLAGWWKQLARILVRPVGAVAMIGLFAASGLLVAQMQIEHRREARLERLAAEYVQSIDPLLMTSGHGEPSTPQAP